MIPVMADDGVHGVVFLYHDRRQVRAGNAASDIYYGLRGAEGVRSKSIRIRSCDSRQLVDAEQVLRRRPGPKL